jgi:hypothetical protein
MKISRKDAIKILVGDRSSKPYWIWTWSDEQLIEGLKTLGFEGEVEILDRYSRVEKYNFDSEQF